MEDDSHESGMIQLELLDKDGNTLGILETEEVFDGTNAIMLQAPVKFLQDSRVIHVETRNMLIPWRFVGTCFGMGWPEG